MPRLTMWNPNKTNDYKFFDRTIREQFEIGGTGAIVHKYLGPESGQENDDPTQPDYQNDGLINETSIQDLLFLENRDRKYEKDLYQLRGVYNVSDNDFDLTQFGLFLTNDVLYMTFHIGTMVERLGRRLMNGDVIELPHLTDDLVLDANTPPVPKFYVVQDGNRGGEGYSATWWSHIWRVKLGPITDSQEFDDILGNADEEDSMKNLFSTYQKEIDITTAVVESAFDNDPVGGARTLTDHLYNYVDESGESFFTGDNITTGDAFPTAPGIGDFFIRTDFQPNRLFVFRGQKWIRLYDNIADQTWSDATFNSSTYVNNVTTDENVTGEFATRQSITEAILARPDYDVSDSIGDNINGSPSELTQVTNELELSLQTWFNNFGV